jgi:hypothetical protein
MMRAEFIILYPNSRYNTDEVAIMDGKTIEGVWDQLIQRSDLRGQRVRVIVLQNEPPRRPIDKAERLRRLQEYSKSLANVTHFIDDSRESIDSATLDDPR